MIRQLTILNENHSVDELSSKRKLNGSDEPILVKKKLNLEKPGERKRKLSEIDGNRQDTIEIVADVKNTGFAKKLKMNEETGGVAAGANGFPWEVTDFDQFDKILNSLSVGEDAKENEDDVENKKGKKKAKKDKKDFVSDKDLIEVEEKAFDPNRAPESIEDYERFVFFYDHFICQGTFGFILEPFRSLDGSGSFFNRF